MSTTSDALKIEEVRKELPRLSAEAHSADQLMDRRHASVCLTKC